MLKRLFGLTRGVYQAAWGAALIVQLGLMVAYFKFYRAAPRPPDVPVPGAVAAAIDETCRQVLEALPRPRVALRPTLVLPLVGDREMLITTALQNALSQQGAYRAVGAGSLEKIADELFAKVGMQRQPVTEPEEAVRLARAASAEVVVLGTVDELGVAGAGASLVLSVRALEAADGSVLLDRTFRHAPLPATRLPAARNPNAWQVGGTAVFALLWPVVLVPLSRRIVRAEHNGLTLVALLLMAAVPAALAWPWAFGGAGVISAWKAVLCVVGMLLAALWCVVVMSWVARAESL